MVVITNSEAVLQQTWITAWSCGNKRRLQRDLQEWVNNYENIIFNLGYQVDVGQTRYKLQQATSMINAISFHFVRACFLV